MLKNGQHEFFKPYADILPTNLTEFVEFSSKSELQKLNGSILKEKSLQNLKLK